MDRDEAKRGTVQPESRWSAWVGLDGEKKLSVVLVTKPNQFPKRAVRVSVEETVCGNRCTCTVYMDFGRSSPACCRSSYR